MTWETLQSLKVAAMKAGDKTRIKVLNDIIVLVQKEHTKGKTKLEVTEDMIEACATKAQKTLEEMVETCPTTADYADRLIDYQKQLAIVREYAPQLITDVNEIEKIVNLVLASNGMIANEQHKGIIMKLVMPVLKREHCDMRLAQQAIQQAIAKGEAMRKAQLG